MNCEWISEGILKLTWLNILPSCLDDRDSTFINSFNIWLRQLSQLQACDKLTFDTFRFNFPKNLAPKSSNLLDEFRS